MASGGTELYPEYAYPRYGLPQSLEAQTKASMGDSAIETQI